MKVRYNNTEWAAKVLFLEQPLTKSRLFTIAHNHRACVRKQTCAVGQFQQQVRARSLRGSFLAKAQERRNKKWKQ